MPYHYTHEAIEEGPGRRRSGQRRARRRGHERGRRSSDLERPRMLEEGPSSPDDLRPSLDSSPADRERRAQEPRQLVPRRIGSSQGNNESTGSLVGRLVDRAIGHLERRRNGQATSSRKGSRSDAVTQGRRTRRRPRNILNGLSRISPEYGAVALMVGAVVAIDCAVTCLVVGGCLALMSDSDDESRARERLYRSSERSQWENRREDRRWRRYDSDSDISTLSGSDLSDLL